MVLVTADWWPSTVTAALSVRCLEGTADFLQYMPCAWKWPECSSILAHVGSEVSVYVAFAPVWVRCMECPETRHNYLIQAWEGDLVSASQVRSATSRVQSA